MLVAAKNYIELFGITFNIDREAFTIPLGDGKGFAIYWYAVIISVGLLIAMFYGFRRAPKFGINTDKMFDVVLVSFIFAFIGARAYYLIFDGKPLSSFSEIFAVRNGGLAIYGGVIGAFASGFIMCKIKKIKVFAMFDLASLGFLIGQGIGRWGNFVNQEAYGAHTDSIFGMTGNIIEENYLLGSKYAAEPPVHPCFLYESFFCLLGFAILHFLSKRRKFDGQIVSLYMIWYGIVRFFIEATRTDSLFMGALKISQVVAVAAVAGGLCLYFILRARAKRAVAESGEYDGLFADYDGDDADEIDDGNEADSDNNADGDEADQDGDQAGDQDGSNGDIDKQSTQTAEGENQNGTDN